MLYVFDIYCEGNYMGCRGTTGKNEKEAGRKVKKEVMENIWVERRKDKE